MAVWLTSDLHFGHANIARFCSRPFFTDGEPDVPRMNVTLIDSINEAVGPGDELWILGDFAMGHLDDTLPLARQFRAGRTVLVAGNHDRIHPSNGNRAARFADQYRQAFDTVIETNTALVLGDGTHVQVSHFPHSVSPLEARARRGETIDRFAEWRPVDDGGWLLCGHVHDAWRQSGRQINVGIDAWGGRPVHENDISRLIHEGPASREPLPWPPMPARAAR